MPKIASTQALSIDNNCSQVFHLSRRELLGAVVLDKLAMGARARSVLLRRRLVAHARGLVLLDVDDV